VRHYLLAGLTILWVILALGLALSCGDDDEDDEREIDCQTPLQVWINQCGFSVNLEGQSELNYAEAYDSCHHGYGQVWRYFVRCYEHDYLDSGGDCAAFAACVPEHGFVSDDDDDDKPDDASPADADHNDDTSPADDDNNDA